jgi:Pyruvate/2-oxoacid:ferredoxin oxidoreductase delta subunit
MRLEEKEKVRMGTVELRRELCLSYKAQALRDKQDLLVRLGVQPTEVDAVLERRGPCGECYTFCPLRERAIKLEPGAFLAPQVFKESCVGCGMCEEICRVMLRGEPAIKVIATREAG